MDLDGWGLESEGFSGFGGRGLGFDEASPWTVAVFGVRRGVVDGGREARGFDVLGVRWGEGTEAGGVRGRLGAELSEVKVGAGAVADVHGFAEALLGVVAVKDDAIEDDGDGFEDHFNETAN